MSTIAANRLKGFAIAAIVLVTDMFVKALVMGPLKLRELNALHAAQGWPHDQADMPILPFFGLTFTQNFGVSFGRLAADSMEMRWALVAVTFAIALVVLVWMLREKKFGEIAALGLVLGGALGNIRDRALYGFVIDYADLHFGDWRPFLIFNIADAAISIGVVIILARALFLREKPASDVETPDSAPETPAAETK